ncbi:S9 family peptidase, partial [Thermococcus sp. M36]|uniref:hypothetical protein n=1 Tax=Thermococcus sp. M36 TaxID=1638261 RepID=UPI0016B8D1C1
MKKIIIAVTCSLMFAVAFAQKEKMKVTDLLNVKTISNVVLNNDGSKAAFTVTTIEPDNDNKGDYKYVNNIWLVAT